MGGELLTYNRRCNSTRQGSRAVTVVLIVTAGPSLCFRCAARHVHLVELSNLAVVVWTVVTAHLGPINCMHVTTNYCRHIFRCNFLVILPRARLTSFHILHTIILCRYVVEAWFIIVNFLWYFMQFLPWITLALNHNLRWILDSSFDFLIIAVFSQCIIRRLLVS